MYGVYMYNIYKDRFIITDKTIWVLNFSPSINYLSPGFNVLCNCSNRAVYTFIMGHCGGDVYTYILMAHSR